MLRPFVNIMVISRRKYGIKSNADCSPALIGMASSMTWVDFIIYRSRCMITIATINIRLKISHRLRHILMLSSSKLLCSISLTDGERVPHSTIKHLSNARYRHGFQAATITSPLISLKQRLLMLLYMTAGCQDKKLVITWPRWQGDNTNELSSPLTLARRSQIIISAITEMNEWNEVNAWWSREHLVSSSI